MGSNEGSTFGCSIATSASGESSDAACTYTTKPCEIDRLGQLRMELNHNYGPLVDTISR